MARFDFFHFPKPQNSGMPSFQHVAFRQFGKLIPERITAQNSDYQRLSLVRESGFGPFGKFREIDKEF